MAWTKRHYQRKKRKGAFWEDRYHATAIETNQHLIQCLVYMDLNMVCACLVSHAHERDESGYKEIQQPRLRYALIDHQCLTDLLEIPRCPEHRTKSEGNAQQTPPFDTFLPIPWMS